MAWDEIKHSVNSDLNLPLDKLIKLTADELKKAIEEGGGGGGSMIKITTETDTFIGKTVTLTGTAGTQTAEFGPEKVVLFKVGYTGNYVATCEGYEVDITVSAIGTVVEAALNEHYSAVSITTKSTEFYGLAISCKKGTDVVKQLTFSSSGKASMNITTPGTYTYEVEYEDKTYKSKAIVVSQEDIDADKTYSVAVNYITVYGFSINGAESDPATMVSYNVNYEGNPVANAAFTNYAKVNLSSGVFSAGDWQEALDEFIMPRPCMLKNDGTVDYYLNPNDFTKKENGAASDVKNTSYAGNAMMEWGKNDKKLWWKVVPSTDKKSGTVYIADGQADEGFHCYNHVDCTGAVKEHFYTPIYAGSYISNKMRSLSGQTTGVSQTGTTEISYATANNTGSDKHWYTETLVDRMLINFLLILISKTTDSQTAFGYGRCSSSNSSAIATGTMDAKGLFWGSSDQTSGVKVFGMENYWGNTWRRIAGLINANGTIKIKLTPGKTDGSTATEYNTDGTGYISLGALTGGTNGGSISEMQFNEYGMYAKTASGSSSTYYPDGYWFNNNQNNYAFVGGAWYDSLLVGALCVDLNNLVSDSYTSIGACLSYK